MVGIYLKVALRRQVWIIPSTANIRYRTVEYRHQHDLFGLRFRFGWSCCHSSNEFFFCQKPHLTRQVYPSADLLHARIMEFSCFQCGEAQSIVKVWGRGGRAKDIRGLTMELNAATGRGEDPTLTVGSIALQQQSGPQDHSKAKAPPAPDSWIGSHQVRAPFIGSCAAPQRRRHYSEEEAAPTVINATWDRSNIFGPGRLGPGDGTTRGDRGDKSRPGSAAHASLEGRTMEDEGRGAGYVNNIPEQEAVYRIVTANESRVFESSREQNPHLRKTAQVSGCGIKGSRWEVFASGADHAQKSLEPTEIDPQVFYEAVTNSYPLSRCVRAKRCAFYRGVSACYNTEKFVVVYLYGTVKQSKSFPKRSYSQKPTLGIDNDHFNSFANLRFLRLTADACTDFSPYPSTPINVSGLLQISKCTD